MSEPVKDDPAAAAIRHLGSWQTEALAHGSAAIAACLGISPTTAREWRRKRHIPPTWRRSVAVLLHGDLGAIDPAWRGWRLSAGRLIAPEAGAYDYTPAELYAARQQPALIALLEGEVEALRRQLAAPEAANDDPGEDREQQHDDGRSYWLRRG